MSILRDPPTKWIRQQRRIAYRKAAKPPSYGETIAGAGRKLRRALGLSLAAVGMLMCASQAQAFLETRHDPDVGRVKAHELIHASAISLKFLHKGVIVQATTYDSRFGTDAATAAAAGWFTFDLMPGRQQVWVDSAVADDTGNGLSFATRKKTLGAALNVLKGLYTIGDTATYGHQLMLAGTGGRSYTDVGGIVNMDFIPGFSATYPTAVRGFDPAIPADTTKYGKLLGQDLPVITGPAAGAGYLWFFGTTYDGFTPIGNIALQGVALTSPDSSGTGSVGRHDNMIFQNVHFRYVGTSLDNSNKVHGIAQGGNISKCVFYGMRDPRTPSQGNANACFLDGITGWVVEDNAFIHCAWVIGSARTDSPDAGGPTGFGHALYYHAGNTGQTFRRNVYVDSASDGGGMRGGGIGYQLVFWDEPFMGGFTGVSGSYLESPSGDLLNVYDIVAFGGSKINSTSDSSGGMGVNNASSGSGADNVVAFDNPRYGLDPSDWFLGMGSLNPAAAPNSFDMSRIRLHNFASIAQDLPNSAPNGVTSSWRDSLLDSLNKTLSSSPAGTISGTNVRTWTGGDYPNPLTADDVVTNMLTGMGLTPGASYAARKAQLVNYMSCYPHLPWAQAIQGIAFPAYGATPQYPTAAIPNVTGLPVPPSLYTAATPTRLAA